MAIWERTWYVRKDIRVMPWFVKGIPGAGLALEDIIAQNLPVPHRDMLPVSMEEQVVCFADKFYSKTHLDREKSVEKARDSLLRYGKAGVQRFDYWCKLFL